MPKHKRLGKEDYQKGDIVWYFSEQGGRGKATKAVFVQYDYDGYPNRDCLLAIRIGGKKSKKTGKRKGGVTQIFRWPLRLVSPC